MSVWDNIAETAAQIERDRNKWLAEQAEILAAPLLPEKTLREARLARYVALGTFAATLAILALTVVLVLR
jgi:uncharacterized membrane protein